MANLIILLILSTLYACLSVCCMVERQRRACQKAKALYLPKSMFWIGFLAGGLFLGFAWLAAKQDGSIGVTICFSLFSLLGMVLMLGWKNSCIVYDKAGFTQKSVIGRHRSFTYEQVTAWCCNKRNPMESSLYAGGKKISFNLMSSNGPDFLTTVAAGYRRTHGNRTIPDLPALQKEQGGFRAHVYNPGEYLAIFIMVLVFVVGTGAWIIIDSIQPIDENDGEQYSLTFSSWEIQEDSLILHTLQMQEPFLIGGYQEYLSHVEQLTKKCNGRETFSVWAKRYDPDDADPFFRVYAISSADYIYRTFEDSTAYQRSDLPYITRFFGVILAFVLTFSAFIYIVGSNPQRFPKWVVYCCFKKNAIDI